ncbi:MAG TPA: redoxin domain-containing protein, partial [Terriglobales bacterium]|nr:redoxin domain-containing protein [Terriglobales bacterium]
MSPEITETVARLPRINEPAPDFEAKSTHGIIRLSNYTSKGKWVMLFSHPADFTPVCTTEFIEFARRNPDFEKRNVQLIGDSIDSVY